MSVESEEKVPLKANDELESSHNLFGTVPKVSLTWQDISYTTKKDNIDILSNVSGFLPPGRILAIIGPSGAGKTTLLHILSGCMIPTQGEIKYNGKIKENTCDDGFNSDIMGYHGNAAYLSQNITLHGSLTVRETLFYCAELKCHKNGRNNSTKELNERVDRLLEYLGLVHCQNTLIGNIFFKGVSGGEKKRVAIGCELITQTSLLFMDEPFSGLDATAAYTLLSMMHGLTLLGHSVIITIHQPSSRIFDLLSEWQHYLMILERGSLAYFGLCSNSVHYFDEIGYRLPKLTNPLDFYLDIVNTDFDNVSTEALTRRFATKTSKIEIKSYKNKNIDTKAKFKEILLPSLLQQIEKINKRNTGNNSNNGINYRVEKNGFYTQVKVLLKRNFRSHLRNPGLYMTRVLMFSALAFSFGLLCFDLGTNDLDVQDRVMNLYSEGGFLCLLSVAAVPSFAEERHIFVRERVNGHYDTLPFVIAHFFARTPWIAGMTLCATSMLELLINLNTVASWNHFAVFSLAIFTALTVTESMMVMLTAVTKHTMVTLAAGAAIQGIFMQAAGIFRAHSMPLEFIPLRAISMHSWTWQINMKNDFSVLDFDEDNVRYRDTEDVMQTYNIKGVNIWFNFLVLVLMFVGYEFLFFLSLKFLNRTAN